MFCEPVRARWPGGLWQANTLTPYLECVRHSLDAALCLRTQPSQNVERHNQPEVETRCVAGLTSRLPAHASYHRPSPPRPSPASLTVLVCARLCWRERRGSKDFLLTPLTILRNPNEGVLIETTINSVRVSVKIDTHADNLEVMLLDKFQKFLVGRAERFLILRRKPVKVRPQACACACVCACGAA